LQVLLLTTLMRIVGEIPHPDCRITLLSWNNRYLIKLEQGFLEQTFKINQFDLIQESDLNKLLDEKFLAESLARFQEMARSLQAAMDRI
jgi:hypothetical protein